MSTTTQGAKKPNAFLKKLKLSCKNCSEASIKVYLRNISRLFNLGKETKEEIPMNGNWLKRESVHKKYMTIDVNKRRHLSIAAVKACQAYNFQDKPVGNRWQLAMLSDASKYSAQRAKNKKSDTEEKLWPAGGYGSVKKASSELLKRLKHQLKEEPNVKTLYRYQMYVALKLYSEVPLRNTLASIQVTKNKEDNYLDMPKRGAAHSYLIKSLVREYYGGWWSFKFVYVRRCQSVFSTSNSTTR